MEQQQELFGKLFESIPIHSEEHLEVILNTLDMALREGGYNETELYFEQSTPLVILSQQAEEQDKSVAQVQDETNESLENPASTDEGQDQTAEEPLPVEPTEKFTMPTSLSKEYEIIKQ